MIIHFNYFYENHSPRIFHSNWYKIIKKEKEKKFISIVPNLEGERLNYAPPWIVQGNGLEFNIGIHV